MKFIKKVFCLSIPLWLFSLPVFGLSVDEKLALQWERYNQAQLILIDKVGKQNQVISREEWEKAISLPAESKWTKEDLAILNERHLEIIENNRQEATRRSNNLVDLDKIRKSKKVNQFCNELPKGGMLHIHPWGTMDSDTVRAILEVVDPSLNVPQDPVLFDFKNSPFQDEIGFLSKYNISNISYRDLSEEDQKAFQELFFLSGEHYEFDRFLGVFGLVFNLFWQNKEAWENQGAKGPEDILWRDLFSRSKEQKLKYLEITRNIKPNRIWMIEALDRLAENAEKEYGIIVRFVAQFSRMKSDEENRKALQLLIPHLESPYLVGINLVDDETENPALEKGEGLYGTLLATEKTGLSKTIHAGEFGDVRNVRDAMIMGADRVGHGVTLIKDPVALEYAIKKKLPIEVNLVSNQKLGVLEKAGIAKHPFLDFLRLGLQVSLSTDDEGIFDTTINECVIEISTTDISYYELKQMALNSIETSFVEKKIKDRLLKTLQSDLRKFESGWALYR